MSLASFDTSNFDGLIAPQATKICATCKEEKPVSFFSKDAYTADGFRWQCKDCAAKAFKQYKSNPLNAEKSRTQKKQRNLARKQNLAKLSEQCVYVYAWKNNLPCLKIGKSTNLSLRFESALCHSPEMLALIALVPTDNAHALEKRLHQAFAPFRLHGEWFQASSFVLRYIDTLSSELAEQVVPFLTPIQQSRIEIMPPQDYIDHVPFLGK